VRAITRVAVTLACLAAAFLAATQLRAVPGSDRTLSFFNIHTKETLTVTYKKGGKHDPAALKQINWMMRDWRKNEETAIDPALIDLIWEMHAELGSKEPVHLICGYRSRNTNEMLRRSVGGQASESRHISGKAADVMFPDVPLKQLRYSALVRERGGVGYYPASGIPFVHLDTDHVRHWPRMPRYELALLFPNGATRHTPSDGGPITKADVATARSTHRDLAQQVAQFLDIRTRSVKTTPGFALASAGGAAAAKVASLATSAPGAMSFPHLVSNPRAADPASRFTMPATADRERLAALVEEAERPRLVSEPRVVERRKTEAAARAVEPHLRLAALDQQAAQMAGGQMPGWGNRWIATPAYDEEHPEELSYRPFPVAPLLTETSSADDPVLAQMTAPDVARTVDLIDLAGAILPLRLRPGLAVTERKWALEFRGEAVNPAALAALMVGGDEVTGLVSHPVRTAHGR
jgi:uncharacterized protein YcbK (DUF882 family)